MTYTALKTMDVIGSWRGRLEDIANEMDDAGDFGDLADHIDSITAELNFKQGVILEDGPIILSTKGKEYVQSLRETGIQRG